MRYSLLLAYTTACLLSTSSLAYLLPSEVKAYSSKSATKNTLVKVKSSQAKLKGNQTAVKAVKVKAAHDHAAHQGGNAANGNQGQGAGKGTVQHNGGDENAGANPVNPAPVANAPLAGPGADSPSGAPNNAPAAPQGPSTNTSNAGIPGKVCPKDNEFCFYGTPTGNGQFEFTIHSVGAGWAAIGVGADMSNAIIYALWKNTNGGYTLSARKSTKRSLPTVIGDKLESVPLAVPAPSWAKIAASFRTPADGTAKISATSEWIWGYGNTAPTNPNDAGSAFKEHDDYGYSGLFDFTKVASANVSTSASLTTSATVSAPTQTDTSVVTTGSPTITGAATDTAIFVTSGVSTVLPTATVTAPSNHNSISGPAKLCPKPDIFCIYGSPIGNGNFQFTIHSSATGYAAIGTGSTMKDSYMYVAWRNSSQGYTVSARKSTSHKLPVPSGETLEVVPLAVDAPSWAKIAVTFRTTAGPNGAKIAPDTQWIWAVSKEAPSKPDDPAVSFVEHDDFGTGGVFDFTKVAQHDGSYTVPPLPTETGLSATVTSAIVTDSMTATMTMSMSSIAPTSSLTPVANTTSDGGADGWVKVCPSPEKLCVFGKPDTPGNFIFTIHSATEGYSSFGAGKEMSSGYIYVAWKNSTSGYTLSARKSTSYKMPAVTDEKLEVLPLGVPAPEWAKFAVTFKTTAGDKGALITPTTEWMWAENDTPPTPIDDPSATFKKHNHFGSMGVVDFTSKTGGEVKVSPTPTAQAEEATGDTMQNVVSGEISFKPNCIVTLIRLAWPLFIGLAL